LDVAVDTEEAEESVEVWLVVVSATGCTKNKKQSDQGCKRTNEKENRDQRERTKHRIESRDGEAEGHPNDEEPL
jgi:hypothetical protein